MKVTRLSLALIAIVCCMCALLPPGVTAVDTTHHHRRPGRFLKQLKKRSHRPRRFMKRCLRRLQKWIRLPGITVIVLPSDSATPASLLQDYRWRHQDMKQRHEPEELNAAQFPTPFNSQHHWVILFCNGLWCERSAMAKVKQFARRWTNSAYKVGFIRCSKSKEHAQFCLTKGFSFETIQFAFVKHGKLRFLAGEKIKSAQSLHEATMQHLAKDYIFFH